MSKVLTWVLASNTYSNSRKVRVSVKETFSTFFPQKIRLETKTFSEEVFHCEKSFNLCFVTFVSVVLVTETVYFKLLGTNRFCLLLLLASCEDQPRNILFDDWFAYRKSGAVQQELLPISFGKILPA